jgi:rieske iron-sulfur protein
MKYIERRIVLKGGLGLGLGLVQSSPASRHPTAGDLPVKADDSALKPLTVDDLRTGGPAVMAWPVDPMDMTVRNGSRFNQIVLVRLDASQLRTETSARAADGVVAYSGICTHDGCEVDDWLSEQQLLHCDCHFSRFDPKDGANVVDGPASRRLPALPLRIENGKLIVAESFTARVG